MFEAGRIRFFRINPHVTHADVLTWGSNNLLTKKHTFDSLAVVLYYGRLC